MCSVFIFILKLSKCLRDRVEREEARERATTPALRQPSDYKHKNCPLEVWCLWLGRPSQTHATHTIIFALLSLREAKTGQESGSQQGRQTPASSLVIIILAASSCRKWSLPTKRVMLGVSADDSDPNGRRGEGREQRTWGGKCGRVFGLVREESCGYFLWKLPQEDVGVRAVVEAGVCG